MRRCCSMAGRTPSAVVNRRLLVSHTSSADVRSCIDAAGLGARRGNVVSAEYTYLYGTKSGFADRFIDKAIHHRMAQACQRG